MTNVLILGANGQIARAATELFLQRPDVRLTLYLRDARHLHRLVDDDRVRVVEGDVLDAGTLASAMEGQDVIYANLAGEMERQAIAIVQAMRRASVYRLIFVTSMGIHDEGPGERFGSVLDPYRKSAAVIEASDLDYTLVRPAWLNDRDVVDYGTTLKGETFENGGETVLRRSVADLIVKLATTPGMHRRGSLGGHATA